MTIQQSWASEIYLNGRLIRKVGILSANPNEVKAYDPWTMPFLLPVDQDTQVVLAIRYVLQPGVLYSKIYDSKNPVLHIRIKNFETSVYDLQELVWRLKSQDVFRFGIFIILFILYFALYIFYPYQKASLYFSLYAFLRTVTHIVWLKSFNEPWVENKFYLLNITEDTSQISYLFMLMALYSLLEQKRGWIYWTLIAFGIICVFLNVWPYELGSGVGFYVFMNFINLESTRISFLAVKEKRRGAWIIAGGTISCLFFWAIYLLFLRLNLPNQYFVDIIFELATLSIPIAISIYLALNLAFISRSLKQKLIDIEDLSQKAVAQEKEKQQILASALRSQMNPHFIFNSLNSIQHYIHSYQREAAESYLSGFAILIRQILDNSAKSVIPLSDELNTIEGYLKLEKARFGERLTYEIIVDENLDIENILVPSMLIQPYIENAILHGLTPKPQGGKITIQLKQSPEVIICIIKDNGIGRQKAIELKKRKKTSNKSYGMSITQTRLGILNQNSDFPVSVNITDLFDEKNEPSGTQIEILMPVDERF